MPNMVRRGSAKKTLAWTERADSTLLTNSKRLEGSISGTQTAPFAAEEGKAELLFTRSSRIATFVEHQHILWHKEYLWPCRRLSKGTYEASHWINNNI